MRPSPARATAFITSLENRSKCSRAGNRFSIENRLENSNPAPTSSLHPKRVAHGNLTEAVVRHKAHFIGPVWLNVRYPERTGTGITHTVRSLRATDIDPLQVGDRWTSWGIQANPVGRAVRVA